MNKIQQITEEARKIWVRNSLVTLKEIERILEEAYLRISNDFYKLSTTDKIAITKMRTLQSQVARELARVRPLILAKTKLLQKRAIDEGLILSTILSKEVLPKADVFIGTSFMSADGVVKKYDATKEAFAASLWYKINTEAMEALVAYTKGGIPLSKRVWDITWAAEKSIRARLEQGILLGHPAKEIARDIKGFLVNKSGFSKYGTTAELGSGVYRSAFDNAMRVARTEMNRGYIEGMYRYGLHKEWVIGYKWRTGSGNPCEVCLDYEGTYFPKSEPPMMPVHPHCMCYPEIIYDENIINRT